MCSARSLVGKGMNAITIRNSTFSSRNSRLTCAIWLMTVWWLAQMIPIVMKLTAYAT